MARQNPPAGGDPRTLNKYTRDPGRLPETVSMNMVDTRKSPRKTHDGSPKAEENGERQNKTSPAQE